MNKGIAINFITEEIIVTKKFLKAAENYGTEEFKTLLQLSKDMPDFKISEKKSYKDRRSFAA